MKYATLLVEKSGPLTTVTFNQPQRLNPLSPQFFIDFKNALDELKSDIDCRFIIFTGAGKAFSCGFDMAPSSMVDRYKMPGLKTERLWQSYAQDIMTTMENLEQITFGAVNGAAVGGGFCFLLNCDFRIASDKASFRIPETRLGMPLSWGATPRMVALIGPAKTKELIMTCDKIDAAEALRIGLVNRVVPHNQLLQSCKEMIDKIALNGPLAIKICKRQVNAASTARLSHLYLMEADLMELCADNGDIMEGMMSFLEKRESHFPSGKSSKSPDKKA
jgi:enoyl-CoA hydratase/carnithine racemase